MRVFLIGGTGFTGPAVVQQLLERDHDVTLFHRGQKHDQRTAGASEILGDRKDTGQLSEAVAKVNPDVAVDMIPFTADDAAGFMRVCRGIAPRVVALSSIDVYLAYGRIQLTEPGPLQATPLTETSALRNTNQPHGPEYDKIAVEAAVMNHPDLPGTILRLPAIYGRGDKYRRFRGYLKRMDDGRDTILLGSSIENWKFSRGYVDNVARAVVLAIETEEAAGEIYNVAEPRAFKEREFVEAIGIAAEWQGDVTVMPDDCLPKQLQTEVDFAQDWEVDSSKIRQQLGYQEVVDIAEAYRRTIEWERENPPDTDPHDYNYEAEDKALLEL